MRTAILICFIGQIALGQKFTFSSSKKVDISIKKVSELDLSHSKTKPIQKQKIALIIGNENYASTLNVPYSLNDAKAFEQYCTRLIGVAGNNLIYLKNSTSIEIQRAVKQVNELQKLSKDSTEVILYYSGHGLASYTGKLQLIPVDVSPIDLIGSIDLFEVCNQLNLNRTKQITVFIDACFSGQSRTQNIITSRGITVVPKYNNLPKNCVVLSASSLNQKAYSYSDKKHGAFTYFLLKELKSKQGKTTIKSLYSNTEKNLSSWSVKNGQIQKSKLTSQKGLERLKL